MHYLAVVVLFPLLFWGLSLGCGLLVERLTGAPLPPLLLLPVGFAALVVVSQFTTWWGPSAPLTPLVLLVLALIGFWLGRSTLAGFRRRPRAGCWWAAGAGIATYVIVAAPVIASGRPTFSGYLLDTTGAIQIAGAERLLQHAHAFSTGLPAYGTTLAAYFGNGYPSGGHSVLASVGWLSGQSLIWLYSVYQALELSLLALVLAFLARRVGLGRAAAAATGTLAAVPALVYAYALMGSIKEMTALPMIALMGALLVAARELRVAAGIRAVLPFALAAAAAVGAIGIAASPWVAFFAAAGLLAAGPFWRRAELKRLAAGALALAAATALLALPTVAQLSKTLGLAEGVSNSDAQAVSDPGNLLRPLKFIQTLGVWLGESHRVDPKYLNQTYVLMGIVGVCVGLGLVWLLRRRAWTVVLFVIGSLVVWVFLHQHGTTWADAKLLVILSPVVVFLALVGAFGVLQARRLEGIVLAAVLAVGILVSDGLLYHGTNIAPTQRFQELETIGARFAGNGPTLAPDFEEYALFLLRKDSMDSPGLAYAGPFTFAPGVPRLYGHSYDLDSLAPASLDRFRTIVMRRSPAWSRPPSDFRLAWKGRYYTVWERDGAPPREHLPLGGSFEPSAIPPCRSIRTLALRATRSHARIAFAPRAINLSVNLANASHSPFVGVSADLEGRTQLVFLGPGLVDAEVRVKAAGRYEIWLAGDVDRPLHVFLDGRLIASPAGQSGDDGTTIDVGGVSLAKGRHALELRRGGGDLRPGDAGSTVIDGLVLEPAGAGAEGVAVHSIAPSAWRSLCGRPLDWLELV
jgi:hypothetical protein